MRLEVLGGVLMVVILSAPAAATGQPAAPLPPTPPAAPVFLNGQPVEAGSAQETRMLLQRLLTDLPPAVRTVLQADPSLLARADYLAPYPRLTEFLKQHPEIARDPAFFFGTPRGIYMDYRERTPQERAINMLEGVLTGLALFTVAITALLVAGSLIRQVIEHRRWLRQSRVQTEVHTKILDRFQSNEDLLAYIQTPAGRRFLESGPSPQEGEPRVVGSPYGRILWSVQAGVMLAALGVGLWLVQRNVMEEVAPVFYSMGVLAMALGIGAALSAAASYALSMRFGLFGPPRT